MLVFIFVLVSKVLRNKRGFCNGRKFKITGAIRKFLKKHFSSQDFFWEKSLPGMHAPQKLVRLWDKLYVKIMYSRGVVTGR